MKHAGTASLIELSSIIFLFCLGKNRRKEPHELFSLPAAVQRSTLVIPP
jgi:hypothetical protein